MIFIFVQTLQREGLQVKSDPNSEENRAKADTLNEVEALAQIQSRAVQAFEAGKLHDAEAALENILKNDPSNVEALGMLALVLKEQGEYPASETTYQRVLELNPNSSTLHGDYAELLVEMDRLEDAKAQYIEAVQLEGTTAKHYYLFGKLLEHLGEIDAAKQGYKEAVVLDSSFKEAQEALNRLESKES